MSSFQLCVKLQEIVLFWLPCFGCPVLIALFWLLNSNLTLASIDTYTSVLT